MALSNKQIESVLERLIETVKKQGETMAGIVEILERHDRELREYTDTVVEHDERIQTAEHRIGYEVVDPLASFPPTTLH